MRPRPVLVDRTGNWRGERDWNVGLLLDVRKLEDRRGRSHWEGLVATARGGGELPWSLEVAWIRQDYLRRIAPPETEDATR